MIFLNIRNAEALESPCVRQTRSKSAKVPIPMFIQTFLSALNTFSASFAMARSSWGNYLLTSYSSTTLLYDIELVKTINILEVGFKLA